MWDCRSHLVVALAISGREVRRSGLPPGRTHVPRESASGRSGGQLLSDGGIAMGTNGDRMIDHRAAFVAGTRTSCTQKRADALSELSAIDSNTQEITLLFVSGIYMYSTTDKVQCSVIINIRRKQTNNVQSSRN